MAVTESHKRSIVVDVYQREHNEVLRRAPKEEERVLPGQGSGGADPTYVGADIDEDPVPAELQKSGSEAESYIGGVECRVNLNGGHRYHVVGGWGECHDDEHGAS